MTRSRIKVSVIVIVVIIFGIIFLKVYNKPHIDVGAANSNFSVSVENILNEFTEDEQTANSKYLEKIVEVKGRISEVKLENDNTIVVLSSNGNFEGVRCYFSENNKVTDFKKGEEISVKGICTGYLLDVILVKCVIIK